MLIKERMTLHPLTMEPMASITEAHRYMKENNIRHLPIVRKDGRLMGLITRETLMKAMPSSVTTLSVWEMNYALSKVKARDVMVRDVITVEEDVAIEKAARITGRQPILFSTMMRAASSIVMSGPVVITSSAGVITSSRASPDRVRAISHTSRLPNLPGSTSNVCRVARPSKRFPAPTTGR